MHPLEIRETRFRLQQQLAAAEDEADKASLEARIEELRASCPHEHTEEDPEKGWRCRDCDTLREPEPQPEEEAEAEDEAPEGEAAAAQPAAATTDA